VIPQQFKTFDYHHFASWGVGGGGGNFTGGKCVTGEKKVERGKGRKDHTEYWRIIMGKLANRKMKSWTRRKNITLKNHFFLGLPEGKPG
jgi:hypothetical protein